MLAAKPLMLVVTIATIGATVYLYYVVPKGFFPPEDTGFLSGVAEGATDTSFEAMIERQMKLDEIIRADPAVEFLNTTVGAGGPNPTANYTRMFIGLKPKAERDAGTGGDRAAAAEDVAGSRHADVLPEHPEPERRRTHLQEPVSVHAAERATSSGSTPSRRRCGTRSRRFPACST